MIRGLIFDFDGLILDTETPIFRAWQEVFRRHSCPLSLATWADYIGRSPETFDPCEHLEAYLSRPVDRRLLRLEHRQREAELLEREATLPGVKDYIASAKRLGLKLGVASSSSRDWVIGHLRRLRLKPHFDCIRCADDVECTKPDPDLYISALEGLELRSDQVVALEDSPNGVSAARRAGIFCVVVPNALTKQLSLDHADLTLASLVDLPLEQLLAQVEKRLRVGAEGGECL